MATMTTDTTDATQALLDAAVALALIDEPESNPNSVDPATFEALRRAVRPTDHATEPGVGFLQPVLLRRKPGGRFEIVDGVHRCRAAKLEGYESVPAVVADLTDEQAAMVQIGMNKMRGELNLAEVVRVVNDLIDDGIGVDELMLTGFSESELNDMIRMSTPEQPDDVMRGGVNAPEDEEPERAPKPYLLELTFATSKELKDVKRKLKKAGAGDLARGLLNIIEGA